jgi:hypothetical protein
LSARFDKDIEAVICYFPDGIVTINGKQYDAPLLLMLKEPEKVKWSSSDEVQCWAIKGVEWQAN